MAIEQGTGNLLKADVDALVNTVNTHGVMGKGLALQFKKAFPDDFHLYERACKKGEIVPGKVHVIPRLAEPRFIINFPTKKHWRQPSRIEYIRDGLKDLIEQTKKLEIRSIAIPPLGCGYGGLDWSDVRPLIVKAFEEVPDVRVLLFEPKGAPPAAEVIDRRSKPNMTAGRAAVLAAMKVYLVPGYVYRLSLVEIQKLAYFLQLAGEPLKLDFKAHFYGPYANTLQKVLRNIDGHYTSGLADGKSAPATPIELLPGAVEEASAFLKGYPETAERLQKVSELIEGFETPFGMELLGTVHWAMTNLVDDPADVDRVIQKVHSWSERKRSTMGDHHIRAAWGRLCEHEWTSGRTSPPEDSR